MSLLCCLKRFDKGLHSVSESRKWQLNSGLMTFVGMFCLESNRDAVPMRTYEFGKFVLLCMVFSRTMPMKISHFPSSRGVLRPSKCAKMRLRPRWGTGAYDAPPDPLVGWGCDTLSTFPTPCGLRRLGLLHLLFKMHEIWSVNSQDNY